MAITTYIVDDQEDIRLLLRVVINADADLELSGEAASGLEALEGIAQLDPEVVVMDQMMPGMSGIEVIREIRTRNAKRPRVVLCSAHLDDQVIHEARDAGVDRCVSKLDVVRIGDYIRQAVACA